MARCAAGGGTEGKAVVPLIEMLRTDGFVTSPVEELVPGTWVKLSAPASDEIARVCEAFPIDRDDLMAAIDPEEKTRLQVEDDYTLILVDVPTRQTRHGEDTYNTIPLGIILTQRNVITVCSEDTPLLAPFAAGRARGFSTRRRHAFTYQLLSRIAVYYQQVLTTVDRRRTELERRIEDATHESDLVSLHELESTLVYLATSLRGNGSVLTRLERHDRARQSEADLDILDDAIVENQQAIEMAQIYRDVIDGTRDLLSSVMDLRLNNVMQRLTSITIIMSIPDIVSGLYGMNVNNDYMPMADAAHGFSVICTVIAVTCVILAIVFRRKRLL